jgi:hypothetical protein
LNKGKGKGKEGHKILLTLGFVKIYFGFFTFSALAEIRIHGLPDTVKHCGFAKTKIFDENCLSELEFTPLIV